MLLSGFGPFLRMLFIVSTSISMKGFMLQRMQSLRCSSWSISALVKLRKFFLLKCASIAGLTDSEIFFCASVAHKDKLIKSELTVCRGLSSRSFRLNLSLDSLGLPSSGLPTGSNFSSFGCWLGGASFFFSSRCRPTRWRFYWIGRCCK